MKPLGLAVLAMVLLGGAPAVARAQILYTAQAREATAWIERNHVGLGNCSPVGILAWEDVDRATDFGPYWGQSSLEIGPATGNAAQVSDLGPTEMRAVGIVASQTYAVFDNDSSSCFWWISENHEQRSIFDVSFVLEEDSEVVLDFTLSEDESNVLGLNIPGCPTGLPIPGEVCSTLELLDDQGIAMASWESPVEDERFVAALAEGSYRLRVRAVADTWSSADPLHITSGTAAFDVRLSIAAAVPTIGVPGALGLAAILGFVGWRWGRWG